jgi:hypothetical protein
MLYRFALIEQCINFTSWATMGKNRTYRVPMLRLPFPVIMSDRQPEDGRGVGVSPACCFHAGRHATCDVVLTEPKQPSENGFFLSSAYTMREYLRGM